MKNLIIVILFGIFITGCVIPQQIEPTAISDIIEFPSKDKKTLFEKTKKWIALNFNSAKTVLDYESLEEGMITINIFISENLIAGFALGTTTMITGYLPKISFQMKDNKVKIDVVSINIEEELTQDGKVQGKNTIDKFPNEESKTNFDSKIESLIQSYTTFINNDKQSSDW